MTIQVKGKRRRKKVIRHLVLLLFLIETKYPSVCAGCNCQIHDQYLLKVSPDLEWHIQCLKCFRMWTIFR